MNAVSPQVSVILPNYNHVEFLTQRLNSILNQTFQDFELIILDDCSTDGSAEVLMGYKNHPKVSHLIYNDKNSGSAFKQWKKGIDLARGDWIWIAESDDYCEANLLSELVLNAGRCSNVVLSYCQSFQVDNTGALITHIDEKGEEITDMSYYTRNLSRNHWKDDYCTNGSSEIESYLLHINTIPNASAVLFSKSAYERANKLFEQMKFCGDWMMWVEILKDGNIAYSSKQLNHFRLHSTTTRVLDTPEKLRLRLAEEYAVASHIKNITQSNSAVNSRLKKICEAYSINFTVKDVLSYLLRPSSYSTQIPLLVFLKSYLRQRINRLIRYN